MTPRPRNRRPLLWCGLVVFAAMVLMAAEAAHLVSFRPSEWGPVPTKPMAGIPVGDVIAELGQPAHDSRITAGDARESYTLYFHFRRGFLLPCSTSLAVEVHGDRVVDSSYSSR
jgi:hypothetical protein